MSALPGSVEVPIGQAVAVEIDRRPYRVRVSHGAAGCAHVELIRDPEAWVPELHDGLADPVPLPAAGPSYAMPAEPKRWRKQKSP